MLEALRTARCAAQMRYQGDPAICRSALLLQARSLITARRTRHAERLLRRAGEGAQPEETGRLPIESELLRGELALTMGSITAARMQAEVALDAARDAGLRLEEGQALRLRGECSLRDGNEADAVRDLEAAAEIFAAIGAELESHRTREVTTRAVAP